MLDNNKMAQCVLCRSIFTKFYLVNMPCEEFDFPPLSDRALKHHYFGVFVRYLKSMGYHIPKFDDTLLVFCSDEESEPNGKDLDYINHLFDAQETDPEPNLDEYDLMRMDDI